ncbi:MAG: hypothetical protein EOM62_17635 [Bacteroidia bacterium]|nr:hypothetical protein [Bacteroidia bacterium]
MSEYQSTFSMPGVLSGIDWGSMADKILANARKPAEQWEAQQDTLELKIGLFQEFSANFKSLRSAVSPLKLASTFNSKMAEFSIISGGDAAGIIAATVNTNAAISRHEIEVLQKATAEARFSKQITGNVGSVAAGTFSINVGGRSADIEVEETDTLTTIAQKINAATDATIDPATGQATGEGLGVTASVIDNRLVINSTNTGLGATTTSMDLTRGSGDEDNLGFTVAKEAPSSGTILSIRDEDDLIYTEGNDFSVASGSDKITWLTGGSATRPAEGKAYTVSYGVNSNVFTFTTKSGTPLTALELSNTYTAGKGVQAVDAEIIIDGLTITRSSNEMDDILDGITLTVNGPGKVIMDITQDAEQAVTGIQDFVDYYNDTMEWINIRLTESTQEESVDDTKSSDFYKKFGLLHGNSMLWQSKSQLRMLMTTPVKMQYTTKTGTPIFGTIESQGITTASSFSITVDGRKATLNIDPSDTLDDIKNKINSASELRYDTNGNTYSTPLATAKIVDHQLVVSAGQGKKFALDDSSGIILDTLGLKSPFSLLSQIGISTESTDYGKSGNLEFDTEKFMEALQQDPESVAAIMNTVMSDMDSYIGNMVDSTQIEVAGGVTSPKGRIASQISTYKSEITTLGKRIAALDLRLELRARGLYNSFAQAEVRLAQLQEQATWLSSTISQLTGTSSS